MPGAARLFHLGRMVQHIGRIRKGRFLPSRTHTPISGGLRLGLLLRNFHLNLRLMYFFLGADFFQDLFPFKFLILVHIAIFLSRIFLVSAYQNSVTNICTGQKRFININRTFSYCNYHKRYCALRQGETEKCGGKIAAA
jgi:hypothetical protein